MALPKGTVAVEEAVANPNDLDWLSEVATIIPFNVWLACHWYNKPVKRKKKPSTEDYAYYFKHNISITTSASTQRAASSSALTSSTSTDYPYDSIKEAQGWWKEVDLPEAEKAAVARENAIKLFKLLLEL